MSTPIMQELQTLQADLVTMEGMVEVLRKSAYSGIQTALLGDSLEVLGEYLAIRAGRLDEIVSGGMH